MTQQLKDKVVVVTGASAGVGRATAREFGRRGARVALLARGHVALEAARKEVEALGGEALAIPTDVSVAEEVERAAQLTEEAFGPIEIWVNNAMNSVFSMFSEITPDEFKRVTEVTYLGQVYGTMSALKRMLPRNTGSIVLVGSALAYRGIPLQSAYCGAKHGIAGFYDSLRCELLAKKKAIRTCMVQLPAMDTTQFGWVKSRLPNKPRPMGRIFTPEVAARAIVYAACNDKQEILVGYPTYLAVYGNKVAPRLVDRILARSGIKGQQTNEPRDPDRQNNLWSPVEEDRGAHGGFADQSHNSSWTLWLTMHGISPLALVLTTAALLIVAIIVFISHANR